MNWIKSFLLYAQGLFNEAFPAGDPAIIPAEERAVDAAADQGEFYFKHNILDRLGSYFKYLERMKKFDREAYDLYAKIGIKLTPAVVYGSTGICLNILEPWVNKNRPTFGAIIIDRENDPAKRDSELSDTFSIKKKDDWMPNLYTLIHFHKLSPRHIRKTYQPTNCPDVYEVTMYHDTVKDAELKERGTGVGDSFAVALADDGTVHVLKNLINTPQRIRIKKGSERGKTFNITRKSWDLSEGLKWVAADHKQDPFEYVKNTFVLAFNYFALEQGSMTKIEVERDGVHGAFSVSARRTAYFFKDRDTTALASDGRRKRIFHIVRPHNRFLASEKVTAVKMHFRGERKFTWNGYRIAITIPGRDALDLTEFNVSGIKDDVPDGLMLDGAGLGDFLRKEIDARV